MISAIRIALVTSLTPNVLKLSRGDFWDGDGEPFDGRSIVLSVALKFGEDDVLIHGALISMDDPRTARFTYCLWPKKAGANYLNNENGDEEDDNDDENDIEARVLPDLAQWPDAVLFLLEALEVNMMDIDTEAPEGGLSWC